ncbi:MAG: hypothetical protein HQK50_09835 [Oligoflexia bacterium]|nr:hypothetical protein [Oligoflexia bacterium]MBF0365863.1 hypothetical protein [Oligoflexia bacterium]
MIANCPNVIAGAKTVALGNGMSYGSGCGLGGGNIIAGCCKAGGGGLFVHGLLPLALVAAIGFLGYKVYTMSKDLKPTN